MPTAAKSKARKSKQSSASAIEVFDSPAVPDGSPAMPEAVDEVPRPPAKKPRTNKAQKSGSKKNKVGPSPDRQELPLEFEDGCEGSEGKAYLSLYELLISTSQPDVSLYVFVCYYCVRFHSRQPALSLYNINMWMCLLYVCAENQCVS